MWEKKVNYAEMEDKDAHKEEILLMVLVEGKEGKKR